MKDYPSLERERDFFVGDSMAKVKKDISGYIITAMVAAVAGAGGGYFLSGGSSGGSEYGTAVKRIKEAREFIAEKGDPNFDDEKALEGMITGYLNAGGDKYTYYYNYNETDATTDMTDEVNGAPTAVGSGFKVDKSKNGNIILTSVTPEMAADKQGLKVNDEIIAIDGISIAEQTYEKYARKILGKDNTEVRLTVLRDGEEFEINFKRDNKGGKALDFKQIGNIGYMRFFYFDDFSIGRLDDAFGSYKNINGIIIDLRECPGGTTGRALDFVSCFVESGKVELKSYDPKDNETLEVKPGGVKCDVPIVVLVNENTASASEIITALLKDGKKDCTLVGAKTFGKGIFQYSTPLESGGYLHYTAGKFVVNGRDNWNGVGIMPDVVVEMDSKLIGTDEDIQLKKAIELLD